MTWLHVLILSVLAEAIVETLKPFWDENFRGPDLKDKVIVLVASIVITVLTGVDLFALTDLNILEWAGVTGTPSLIIGSLLSGILISRGANWIHDLAKRILGLVVPKP